MGSGLLQEPLARLIPPKDGPAQFRGGLMPLDPRPSGPAHPTGPGKTMWFVHRARVRSYDPGLPDARAIWKPTVKRDAHGTRNRRNEWHPSLR